MYIICSMLPHVAIHLFSDRSQITSKCGKNTKVAHEAIAKCVTDVLTILQMATRDLLVLYNK